MRKGPSPVRVGLVLAAALAVFALGIILVGEETNLFRRKSRYSIRFETVGGLNSGNPVQLNGVTVGTVEEVILPRDPAESQIRVWIRLDRRYAERVRGDSTARIKTLGLLGDKYVEISSGSPEYAVIADGGEIPTAPATSVDRLMETGEDVMDNVTAITFSLRDILERLERGEGFLGELTTESETGDKMKSSLVSTLESFEQAAEQLSSGEGPLPRLLSDRELGDRLAGSVEKLDNILARADSGEGLLPALLDDAAGKERFDRIMDRLDETIANLEELTEGLAEGDGLLPKLLQDEEYSDEVSRNLAELIERLNRLSEKMAEGDGTVARLLDDPQIYESLNDILIGVDESWMLRWLLRNRQKAGIEARYEEAREEQRGGAKP